MRVGGGVKNRKARLPARDADKHTCAELYALTCRHTCGLKRPKWPSKSWRFTYNYNPTYFREEWKEKGKHWMWFYSSEPEHKHWRLYWALTTQNYFQTLWVGIFFWTLWGRSNKWERENLTEHLRWTTRDVCTEFMAVFRLPGRGGDTAAVILDTVAARHHLSQTAALITQGTILTWHAIWNVFKEPIEKTRCDWALRI